MTAPHIDLSKLPLELVQKIIHFSIRSRCLKRALRLRLVSRFFRELVEDDMFHTRYLDSALDATLREIHCLELDRDGGPDDFNIMPRFRCPNRSVGRDTPWFAFLKRYVADRVYVRPQLGHCADRNDRDCAAAREAGVDNDELSRLPQMWPDWPTREGLIHLAAARLADELGDSSEAAMRAHVKALCDVVFWERYCCFDKLWMNARALNSWTHRKPSRHPALKEAPADWSLFKGPIDARCAVTNDMSDPSFTLLDHAIKELLLDMAICTGDISLTRKMYALAPNSRPNAATSRIPPMTRVRRIVRRAANDSLRIQVVSFTRSVCQFQAAAAHGTLELVQLVHRAEFQAHAIDEQEPGIIMEIIRNTLHCNRDPHDIVRYLLGVREWDPNAREVDWTTHWYPCAMMCAPDAKIFKVLETIGGAPNPVPLRANGIFGGQQWTSIRLDYHAEKNNVAMVRYLLDRRGGYYNDDAERWLNNPRKRRRPAFSGPELSRVWEDDGETALYAFLEEDWTESTCKEIRQTLQFQPLLRAVNSGNLEMVRLMLERGADPNSVAKYYRELELHREKECLPISKLMTPLAAAVRRGDKRMVDILVEHGATDIDGSFGRKMSAIPMALAAENEDMVRHLLTKGFALSGVHKTFGETGEAARNNAIQRALDEAEMDGLESLRKPYI